VSEVKIANPGPLGLLGFGLTTLLLSIANAGLYPKGTALGAVLSLALVYGGGAQLLAGMWEFRSGNTFGATAFTSYGAFWLAIALSTSTLFPGFSFLGPSAAQAAADPSSVAAQAHAFAYFLLGWTIITGIFLLGTLRINLALLVLFALLFVTFLLLTLGAFNPPAVATDTNNLTVFGGYVGIATAIVAFYTALAGILASVGMNFLPTFSMAPKAS